MDPHALVAALLAALLACVPRVPQPQRGRIERTRDAIVAAGVEAEVEDSVPAGVLLVTAFYESHLGTDDGEGGSWGAPIDSRHRHTAGTPAHASRALARGRAVCGTWRRAVARFRSGLCDPWQDAHKRYVRAVARTIERVYQRAGVPLPDRW